MPNAGINLPRRQPCSHGGRLRSLTSPSVIGLKGDPLGSPGVRFPPKEAASSLDRGGQRESLKVASHSFDTIGRECDPPASRVKKIVCSTHQPILLQLSNPPERG